MQKVFDSLRELDKAAEEKFCLGNGILMENAARGMIEKIKKLFPYRNNRRKKTLQIVCGSGDNGGDGFAAARMLADYFNIVVVQAKPPKTQLCKLQRHRLDLLGIPVYSELQNSCDVLLDSLFGTGLKGSLNNEDIALVERINSIKAFKIACDIPSGLNELGNPCPIAVHANVTFSMGALKTAIYADLAKDFTGKIFCIDLGLPRSIYESCSNTYLLEKSDLKLPKRITQNTHKGTFGHAVVVCGEKEGAAVLAACASLSFGAGLVTICGKKPAAIPMDLMHSYSLIDNYTALALGPGLGTEATENVDCGFSLLEDTNVQEKALVLDADVFKYRKLPSFLPHLKRAVLTPHVKEFQILLNNTEINSNAQIKDIQRDRFAYLRRFSEKFPNIVIVLKGSYSLIASSGTIFINPFGTPALSKAGTGDVLTGMITALLAQGYGSLEAALNGSIAHGLASKYAPSSYSLTASSLISSLSNLSKI